jgi:hypothetical protein
MAPRLPGRTVEEKLRLNVEPGGRLGRCLIWQGCVSSNGYGHISLHGKAVPVHRVAFELWVGPLTCDDTVDHVDACREPLCINPAHLEAVTSAENTRRMHLSIRESKRLRDAGVRDQCGAIRGGSGRVVCEMERSWHRTHKAPGSHLHHGRGPAGRWYTWE